MPLLIDTFIEVAPNKRENKNSSEISLQTASILKCILNIILLLWKIFQNADNPSEMVCICLKEFWCQIFRIYNSPGHVFHFFNF